MGNFTLDEVIKILRQHNVTGASVLRITRGQALEKDLLAQVLDSCEQLISEKAEYKRLLKLAVEGYSFIGHITKDYTCPSATSCLACPMDEGKQCRIWEHADEALALIGEDGDTNERYIN